MRRGAGKAGEIGVAANGVPGSKAGRGLRNAVLRLAFHMSSRQRLSANRCSFRTTPRAFLVPAGAGLFADDFC